MSADFSSFDALARWIARLPTFDDDVAAEARARQANLTKPPRALGRLEDIAEFMAGWQRHAKPTVERAHAIVFAGNHGVCAQGINPFPQAVTAQMVANFQSGGAAINQLCQHSGAELQVVPLDLDQPTADFTQNSALTELACLAAMQAGFRAVPEGVDLLLLGEMGIGNSTVSAALCHTLFGETPDVWTGPGTGADASIMQRKREVVAIARRNYTGLHPFAVLAGIGGREQAALCGAVLAARHRRVPVLLDGFICCAAVAPLFALDPAILAHCLISHRSREPGHKQLLDAMQQPPLLDLDMALGEGSGSALALNIVKAALACHNGMATFADAGVSSQ